MARTAIAVNTLARHGMSTADVTYTAGDAANDHEFVNDGKMLLLIKNADASPKTVDVKSVSDPYGRTDDTSVSVAAGAERVIGPFTPAAWNRIGADAGKVFIDITDDTSLSFAVLSYSSISD